MNNITPFGRNLLVLPAKKKTAYATEDNKSICEYGKVISAGKDVKEIKVGDTIAFVNHGLLDLTIDETILYFVPEVDHFILGIIGE